MSRPRRSPSSRKRNDSFEQFPFPRPNLGRNFEAYTRFIFSKVAFPEGTPCAIAKNGDKFLPKGDLSPVALRQHADGESIVGVSLTQRKTKKTKAVCLSLTEKSIVQAMGQATRMIATLEQAGLTGVIELCPDQKTRIWTFFPEPLDAPAAIQKVTEVKKKAFVTKMGEIYPSLDGTENYVVLPPYLDAKSERCSILLTIEEAETIMDGGLIERNETDWGTIGSTTTRKLKDASDPVDQPLKPGERKKEGDPKTGKTARVDGKGTVREVSNENSEDSVEKGMPTPTKEETGNEALLSDLAPVVIGRLLDPAPNSIPSPSETLNRVTNGGWGVGKLYLLAGPSGEGKTTFTAWASDFAANNGVPVLFLSFQVSKEQLTVFALSRTARIDSSLIEGRKWMDPDFEGGANLSKALIAAGRGYYRTGDQLHVVEPDRLTTTDQIQKMIQRTRERAGLSKKDPLLVVVDSLREVRSNVNPRGAHSQIHQETADVMLDLKRIAKQNQAAILVTLDVRSQNIERKEWTPPLAVERDFDFSSAVPFADTAFFMESRSTRLVFPGSSVDSPFSEERRLLDPLDHLLEENGHPPQLAKQIQELRSRFPLEQSVSAVYCRLALLKNRGGRSDTHPIFVYNRAFHDFEPISFDNTKGFVQPDSNMEEPEAEVEEMEPELAPVKN